MIAGTLVATGVGLYISPKAGVSVLAGSVLIDVDHYLWYFVRFKDWSLGRAVKFFEAKRADHYYCLCFLHTLEAMAVYVACLLWMKGPVFWFSVGCLMHMVLDIAQSIRDRGLFRRRWSLIYAIFSRAKAR